MAESFLTKPPSRSGFGVRQPALPNAVLVLALIALGLGIFFRFYHLDRKVYSGDEVYTSLRMLGDVEAQLVRQADHFHDAHDLWLVLHPTPPQGATDPFATVRGLALEEPQHPPIYYLLGHFWLGVFGNSIAAIRGLSAVISLLALPLAFWLGIELYGRPRAGWIAVALFALSPIGVLYAQEAREYALWTVALLALSATLLRAIRLDRPADWWLVAALATFGLYVYPLTFLVLAGLAAYVLLMHRANRPLLLRCALAFAGGALAFLPWGVVLLGHVRAVARSVSTVLSGHLMPGQIARAFAALFRLNVFDANLSNSRLNIVMTALTLLLLLCAIAFVLRRQPASVSLFLLLPIVFSTVPLLVVDFFGGESVLIPRYFMPSYIYLDYCLVGLLSAAIAARSVRIELLGFALFVSLLAVRAASCVASSQATMWWNKMGDNSVSVASAVNHGLRPVIVSDEILDYPLVLANYLRPGVALSLRPRCYLCEERAEPKLDADILPPRRDFTDLFALGPSPQLQSLLHTIVLRRHLHIIHHCINVRHNCVSDLNVEPVFPTGYAP